MDDVIKIFPVLLALAEFRSKLGQKRTKAEYRELFERTRTTMLRALLVLTQTDFSPLLDKMDSAFDQASRPDQWWSILNEHRVDLLENKNRTSAQDLELAELQQVLRILSSPTLQAAMDRLNLAQAELAQVENAPPS